MSTKYDEMSDASLQYYLQHFNLLEKDPEGNDITDRGWAETPVNRIEDELHVKALAQIEDGMRTAQRYYSKNQKKRKNADEIQKSMEAYDERKDIIASVSRNYILDRSKSYGYAGHMDLSGFHFFRMGYEIFAATTPDFKWPELAEPKALAPLDSGSADIIGAIKQGQNLLTENVKNALSLSRGHGKVKVARRKKDFDPDVVKTKARGHGGLSAEFSPAWFEPWSGEIGIMQEFRFQYLHGEYIRNDHGLRSYLHETGHAFDFAMQEERISHTTMFKLAYKQDIEHLKSLPADGAMKQKFQKSIHADTGASVTAVRPWDESRTLTGRTHSLAYFLSQENGGRHTSDDAGRDEAFAELFNTKFSGEETWPGLTEVFAKTAQLIDRYLDSLDYEFSQPIDLNAALDQKALQEKGIALPQKQNLRPNPGQKTPPNSKSNTP